MHHIFTADCTHSTEREQVTPHSFQLHVFFDKMFTAKSDWIRVIVTMSNSESDNWGYNLLKIIVQLKIQGI